MSENIIHVTIGGETYVFDTTHPNTAISLQQLGVDLAALPNFGIHLQGQFCKMAEDFIEDCDVLGCWRGNPFKVSFRHE